MLCKGQWQHSKRSKQLLIRNQELLPFVTVQQLNRLSAEINDTIRLCQEGSVSCEAFSGAVASSQEAEALLWTAIVDLETQLAATKEEVNGLKVEFDKVLLREMAYQFENKLYRYVRQPPAGRAFTPIEVRTASIARLTAVQKKGVLRSIQRSFPNALTAVDQLKQDGSSSAHPFKIKDEETTEERDVQYDDLQKSIERVHADSFFKNDFETLLRGLQHLASQLGEPLFVRTVAEKQQ